MSIVSILIPVSLVLLGVGIWAFFWAVREGQFEELDAASWEILLEDRAETPGDAPRAGGAHPGGARSGEVRPGGLSVEAAQRGGEPRQPADAGADG